MPDRRTHRGPHPDDRRLFAEPATRVLREAAADLVWLLDRGYAFGASTKLVGDRFQLAVRQRAALQRTVCTSAALAGRLERQRPLASLAGDGLRVDAFNVLTTVEAALGGAVVVRGRDGTYRDLVGVHGSYRRIAETLPAMLLLGEALERAAVGPCVWLFDRPVSNSGRLSGILLGLARERSWPWEAELVFNPDAELRRPGPCVASADGAVLDGAPCWVNLVREVVDAAVPSAWIVAPFPAPGP